MRKKCRRLKETSELCNRPPPPLLHNLHLRGVSRPPGLVSPGSTPLEVIRGTTVIEVAPEVEDIEEVEAQPDPLAIAMVVRDVSLVEAPGTLVVSVVERKSRVSAATSVVGKDISSIRALIGRRRPAITRAAVVEVVVVIAVVATGIAVVEEGEEVAPSHKKLVSSRETSRDSPACARWGVPIADHHS